MRFGIGSIALQESVLYAHAPLCSCSPPPGRCKIDGHVRVDVFYAQARPRTAGR